MRYHISSSGPTRYLACISLALTMLRLILSRLPSKSKAHWLREQAPKHAVRPIDDPKMAAGAIGDFIYVRPPSHMKDDFIQQLDPKIVSRINMALAQIGERER